MKRVVKTFEERPLDHIIESETVDCDNRPFAFSVFGLQDPAIVTVIIGKEQRTLSRDALTPKREANPKLRTAPAQRAQAPAPKLVYPTGRQPYSHAPQLLGHDPEQPEAWSGTGASGVSRCLTTISGRLVWFGMSAGGAA